MLNRDEIVELALTLPPEDRSYVADAIEQSLNSEVFPSAEVEAAWIIEVERRLLAYDCGDVQALNGQNSIARLRQALSQKRAEIKSSH